MFTKLMNFFIETFGIQFVMQYMGGKVLDKITIKKGNVNDEKVLWSNFYAKVWELL